MKVRNFPGNAIIVALLGLSIQCGVNNPVPAPGTITGTGSVVVQNHDFEDYDFNSGGTSYGSITFSYEKGSTWERIELSAPDGVQEGSGNVAPATGYALDIKIELTGSYFFRPDSLHYGHLEITNIYKNSSASIGFNWIIQTEADNRELY